MHRRIHCRTAYTALKLVYGGPQIALGQPDFSVHNHNFVKKRLSWCVEAPYSYMYLQMYVSYRMRRGRGEGEQEEQGRERERERVGRKVGREGMYPPITSEY